MNIKEMLYVVVVIVTFIKILSIMVLFIRDLIIMHFCIT
jgi:hypothetical protein